MALHPHTGVTGRLLTGGVRRVYAVFRAAMDGTITIVRHDSDQPCVGGCTFDLEINGVSMYPTLGDRPALADTETSIEQVENQVVAKGDTIEFAVDLTEAFGSVGSKLSSIMYIEDGLPTYFGGTSVTSIAIGTGSKIFTTQLGLAYVVGSRVRMARTSAPTTTYMEGVVTAYSGTTLTILSDLAVGSGSHTDWTFSIAGEQGPTGATGPTGPTGPAGGIDGGGAAGRPSFWTDADTLSSDAGFLWDNTKKQLKIISADAEGGLYLRNTGAGAYFSPLMTLRNEDISSSSLIRTGLGESGGGISVSLGLGATLYDFFSIGNISFEHLFKVWGGGVYGTAAARMWATTYTAGTLGFILQLAASQSVDAKQVLNSSAVDVWVLDKNGTPGIKVNAAPADGDIDANQMFYWFDSTNGIARVKFKAKQANGTVVSGQLALTATGNKRSFTVAASDESTDITTGTGKIKFRMPFPMALGEVRASASDAPTGADLIIDINEEGSTILSTKLRIEDGDATSVGGGTPAVISDAALADDAEISIDFDQVGSTNAGKGVKVTFIEA